MAKDPIVSFVGKLPLGGRTLIRNWTVEGLDAVDSRDKSRQFSSVAKLSASSAIHALGAAVGVAVARTPARNGSVHPLVRATANALYIGANGMASYTQARLALEVARAQPKQGPTTPVWKLTPANYPDDKGVKVFGQSTYSNPQLAVDAATTYGATGIWLAVNSIGL